MSYFININKYFLFRKRHKDVNIENGTKKLESKIKTKPMLKVKSKDSDDEYYIAWKKPDLNTPTVTLTSQSDNANPSSSFRFKPNILTKKHLESFNVRHNHQMNFARAIFADGDDGFESLNGYNSNVSDGENKTKILPNEDQNEKSNINQHRNPTKSEENSGNVDGSNIVSKNVNLVSNASVNNKSEKEDDEKSLEPDSDENPTSSPNINKRTGVRFRNLWIQDNIQRTSSDYDFANIKKKPKVKKSVNFILKINK